MAIFRSCFRNSLIASFLQFDFSNDRFGFINDSASKVFVYKAGLLSQLAHLAVVLRYLNTSDRILTVTAVKQGDYQGLLGTSPH